MLRLGFRLLWRHVERARSHVCLGESRLESPCFASTTGSLESTHFLSGDAAARQALESRSRIAPPRKEAASAYCMKLIIKWRPYTNALRALLQRKLNRALATWRNSGMMRMGWRAAVARARHFEQHCGSAAMAHATSCVEHRRMWRADTVACRLRAAAERRHLIRRLKQWKVDTLVADSQTERRFLQRAGRRWRNLLKRRCVRKWRISTKARVKTETDHPGSISAR